MRHRWLTLVTVVSLYGTYRLYAAVISPITEPEPLSEQQVSIAPSAEIKPPSITSRIAEQHLPDQVREWAASAKYQLRRSEESVLYFDSHFLIADDKENRIRVRPFALVWIDHSRPEAPAYTLVCDSAVFEFESKIQFNDFGPGRIVGGQLQGEVTITGPDHLRIRGRNFYLSERDQRFHSDSPVEFAYGPQPGEFERVRGRAGRVDITFDDHSGTVLGNDLPRLGGLQRVRLINDVAMELVMEQHGIPMPVSITSKESFTYDFESLLATFHDQVTVDRRTNEEGQQEQYDRLRSDYLSITFDDERQDSGSLPRRDDDDELINLDLEFRSMTAQGEEVLLGSDENELKARMQELYYNAITKTIEMRHNAGPVEAYHRHDELHCPVVRLTHDDDDRLITAECEQAGKIIRRNPQSGQVDMEARWKKRLRLAPDGETGWDRLSISGDAQVAQYAQKSGIMADTLSVWLNGRSLQGSGGDVRAALANTGDGDELPVKRVVASSDVALVSPSLHLETQHLEADFIKGTVTDTGSATEESSPSRSSSATPSGNEATEDQPVAVSAESVSTQLVFDPLQNKTDIKKLIATTNVLISRASPAADDGPASRTGDPFSVESQKLTLTNDEGNHILQLEGTPARIRHPEAQIEGKLLSLDRQQNLATVKGEGSLTVLVESDLEGQSLENQRQDLTIRWNEAMRFDGKEAVFLDNVRASLAESLILSQKMSVFLNRRLSFTEDEPATEGLEIDRVDCAGQVLGQFKEWDGEAWTGFRRIQVNDFVMERESGNFRAQGPGEIKDWSRGGSGQRRRVRIDSTASSSANQPLRNDDWPWDYTGVEFAGEMTGNHRDRHVTLSDRVEVMHGPVERPFTVLNRDEEFAQETERSKKAVFLGSDKLQVSLVGGEAQTEETVQVIAWGHAELEGLVFGGRSHSISYDESNGMFTLKGRGTDAFFWHQAHPGAKSEESYQQTIQIIPSEMLNLDKVRSIQGGR